MAKKYLIALDDGHGMETPGKRTPPLTKDLYINGKLIRKKGQVIKENEFNKAVVNYLEKALKRCGFDVLLVAAGDSDVSLKTRVSRANKANADAYISKHYNAVGGKWQSKAKGLVTIIHYNSSNTSIGHVGIYIGGNSFIHAANPKEGVVITSLSSSYYQKRYVGARRVK